MFRRATTWIQNRLQLSARELALSDRESNAGFHSLIGLFVFGLLLIMGIQSFPQLIPDLMRRYAFQGYLVVTVLIMLLRGYRPLVSFNLRALYWTVGLSATTLGIFQLIDWGVAIFFPRFEIAMHRETSWPSAEHFFFVAVLAPVAEEFFFRDFVFRGLLTRFGYRFSWAMILGSLFFMVAHLQVYPGAFVLGLVGCVVVGLSRSIYPSILFHSICNLSWFYIPILFPNLRAVLEDWGLIGLFYR